MGHATTLPGAAFDHSAILHGLPYKSLGVVAARMGIGPEDLARRIGVSRTTFHRKNKLRGPRFSPLESDALARYDRLMAKALTTFDGDASAARTWLATPQPGLAHAVPIERARTTPGFREVEQLLTRIDFGVYA